MQRIFDGWDRPGHLHELIAYQAFRRERAGKSFEIPPIVIEAKEYIVIALGDNVIDKDRLRKAEYIMECWEGSLAAIAQDSSWDLLNTFAETASRGFGTVMRISDRETTFPEKIEDFVSNI